MFKKLVSNLPFNPGLMQQVSFYGKRLHREEGIRRISAIFMALTLLVNIVAITSPAENTYAASSSNIMPGGGSSSKATLLAGYDKDPWVRAVYESFYISRADIEKMELTTINTKADWARPLVTAGRRANGSAGEYPRSIAGTNIYVHSLDSAFSADTISAFVCEAAVCGTYKAIAVNCGNPIRSVNETPTEEPDPLGYVDGVNCNQMFGWAFNNQNARYVHIYIDRQPFTGAVAGSDYFEVEATQNTRTDIPAVFPHIPSSVGWSWDGGPLRGDGKKHTAWVYVTDRGTNIAALENGQAITVDFNCPAPVVVTCPSGTLAGQPAPGGDIANCPADSVPVATCQLLSVLSAVIQRGTEATFTANVVALNGATIQSYEFDFGDGTREIVTSSDSSVTTRHRYTTIGEYTANFTAKTSVGDRTSEACAVSVVVQPTPVPCPYDDTLLLSDTENCVPCPENPTIPQSNTQLCKVVKTIAKSVSNTTQKITDANNTTAKAGDILEYSLITTNTATKMNTTHITEENISDLLDYADVLDAGGSKLDERNYLVWPEVAIVAGQQLVQKFTVQIKNPVPATATSISDAGTFDLKLVNVYGNSTLVNVACPAAKCISQTATQLPYTGPNETLLVTFFAVCVIGFFYSRSKVLAKEIDIVRYEYSTGA